MASNDEVGGAWTARAIDLLRGLAEREGDRLHQAARWCADAIAAGGLVHLFGAGHSRIAVEEMSMRLTATVRAGKAGSRSTASPSRPITASRANRATSCGSRQLPKTRY